jgi:hypothetical protein
MSNVVVSPRGRFLTRPKKLWQVNRHTNGGHVAYVTGRVADFYLTCDVRGTKSLFSLPQDVQFCAPLSHHSYSKPFLAAKCPSIQGLCQDYDRYFRKCLVLGQDMHLSRLKAHHRHDQSNQPIRNRYRSEHTMRAS